MRVLRVDGLILPIRQAIVRCVADRNVASIPGSFTPTEIFRAWTAGASMVKVFPALLAPLVLRYLLPDRQSAARWLTAFAATASICRLMSRW